MVQLIKSKFSLRCEIAPGDRAKVKRGLAERGVRLSLSHRESMFSFWIKREDCVQGGFEFRLDRNSVVVDADFTARVKFAKSSLAEIRAAADHTWEFDSVEGPEFNVQAFDADGNRRDVPVEILTESPAGGRNARNAEAGSRKAEPVTKLRWQITSAAIDLEGSDPDEAMQGLFGELVAALKKKKLSVDEAGARMRPHLVFEFDSSNLDAPIREIVSAKALKGGKLSLSVPLDEDNASVTVALAKHGRGADLLKVTAEVLVPIGLRSGVSAADATEWLAQNGGAFAGCLGPWCWLSDDGQEIEILASA
jgi:hypothetical protein